MFPEAFQIGPISLHTYGIMVALGILIGVALSEFLWRQQGGEPGKIVDLSFMVVLSGLIGARIVFVLVNLDYYRGNPLEIFMIWKGGLVFFGALIGGALGLAIAVRLYRLPFWAIMDITAPGMALGHTLGRLGCFSAGCCFGEPTTAWWAVTFTDPRCLATDVLNTPVHPTQLYSFFGLLALAVFLVWKQWRKSFDGQIIAMYIGIYSIFRFIVEFFRGDFRGGVEIAGTFLSTSQIFALALLPLAISIYIYCSRKEVVSIQ
ncbi:prolipoprotein diacylglyceryl transferase [bacterium]|nr:MAG: prolipoprotein diacylglyceryl transferase [bacterium]